MSSATSSDLIFQLDTTLRSVLKQPTIDNTRLCFSLIKQCYYRRIADQASTQDDSLYIPGILVLRQFKIFVNPSIFDELIKQFMNLLQLIPIQTKKILDDLLCIISIILTQRIMTTKDEFQQDLFVQFIRTFFISTKTNLDLFYKQFLANFNQNLPIVGHCLSCLLQLYEQTNTLDYRINIIDTIWSLIYIEKNESENEYRLIMGQILACFLPGILKTLSQNLRSSHQRLVQANFILLSYILRITVYPSTIYNHTIDNIKTELRDIIVERDQQWLIIVDTHIHPVLQHLTTDFMDHESFNVRRALSIFMLTILCYLSTRLHISANVAMKTLLILISMKDRDENAMLVKYILRKLFKLPIEQFKYEQLSDSIFAKYENEFLTDILNSSRMILPDNLLIQCQNDLFQLLNQQLTSSTLLNDRRWRLRLFIGYYEFLHQQIDFLLSMDVFTDKLLNFILNTFDFDTLIRSNINLLHGTSLPMNDTIEMTSEAFNSIYKNFKVDVHDELNQLIQLIVSVNTKFIDYSFEKINLKKITDEKNLKLFYLFSIIYNKIEYTNNEHCRLLLSFLNQLIYDDNENRRKQKRRRKQRDKEQKDVPISIRNFTIYFLLHSIRSLIHNDQAEYLIDYVPLLILCHASIYTILNQTSLYLIQSISNDIPSFLITQSEYIIDSSLKKLQTSSYDGYLILIEFVRLGRKHVVNLPIMTHVIEQLLLELSCLPPIEIIELTFQFLNVFCQQVVDITNKTKVNSNLKVQQSPSLIEYALDLQKQPIQADSINDENEKNIEYVWHKMLASIIDVFQHFISHSNVHVRSYVLDAFPSLAHLLSTIDENSFLPLVHKFWPGLVHRLYDSDINIRIRCLTTIQCLCNVCSDFVDRRIRQDILPIFIQQLENNRFISSSNTLEYRYMKCLLTNIGFILNSITINVDDIEKVVILLLQYLLVDHFAPFAFEQLISLTKKHSDIIWLKLILHDENEYRKGYFQKMKVYKPEPMLNIDPRWKTNLMDCLINC